MIVTEAHCTQMIIEEIRLYIYMFIESYVRLKKWKKKEKKWYTEILYE